MRRQTLRLVKERLKRSNIIKRKLLNHLARVAKKFNRLENPPLRRVHCMRQEVITDHRLKAPELWKDSFCYKQLIVYSSKLAIIGLL